MSAFDPKKKQLPPALWQEIASESIDDSSSQYLVIGGIIGGLFAASVTAFPPTGLLVAGWAFYAAWRKTADVNRNEEAISSHGCVAHVLRGDRFRDFARQVGQEEVLRQIAWAEENGYRLSADAEDFLFDAPKPENLKLPLTETPQIVAASTSGDAAQILPKGNDLASQMGAKVIEFFNSHNMKVDWGGAILGPGFYRIKLKPHPGVKFKSLEALDQDMKVSLGVETPPLILPEAGFVAVDIARKDRQVVRFEDFSSKLKTTDATSLKVVVGINLEGQLVEIDLADANSCHCLISGITGSGKTEWEIAAVASLVVRYNPQQVKIAIVDTKRVSFGTIEGSPWLYEPIIKDDSKAIALFWKLVAQMRQRYELFEKHGVKNLAEYNALPSVDSLPRIVVMVDEFADLMAGKDTATHLEDAIKQLGAMARAAGIHLLMATQRPVVQVVSGIIKANLPGRICLRVASENEGAIALGSSAPAHNLLGKGDLILQVGSNRERLQGLLVCDASVFKGGHPHQPPTNIENGADDIDIFGSTLKGLPVCEVDEASFLSLPSLPSPENALEREQFEAIKAGRKEGKKRNRLIQEVFGVSGGGSGLEKWVNEYWRIIDKYLAEWVKEAHASGLTPNLVIELIWDVNRNKDREKYLQCRSKLKIIAEQLVDKDYPRLLEEMEANGN